MGREEQQRRGERGAAALAMVAQTPQLAQLDEIIHRTLLGSGARPVVKTKRSRARVKGAVDLEDIARLSKRVLVEPPPARRKAKARVKKHTRGGMKAVSARLPAAGSHRDSRASKDAAAEPGKGALRAWLHTMSGACAKLRAGEAFAFAFCIVLVVLLALNVAVALFSGKGVGTIHQLTVVESKIDRHFEAVHSHLEAALDVHTARLERRAKRGKKKDDKAHRAAHRAAKRMNSRVRALERSAHAVVRLHNGTLRSDFRCGAAFDDSPCNASSPAPCCSRHGWCGPRETHCDGREHNGVKSRARQALRGAAPVLSDADAVDRINLDVLSSPPGQAPLRTVEAVVTDPPTTHSGVATPPSTLATSAVSGTVPVDEAVLEEFFASVVGDADAASTLPGKSSAHGVVAVEQNVNPFAQPVAAPMLPARESSAPVGAKALPAATAAVPNMMEDYFAALAEQAAAAPTKPTSKASGSGITGTQPNADAAPPGAGGLVPDFAAADTRSAVPVFAAAAVAEGTSSGDI